MKILAINSSPRGGGQSKTELMLNHLVKGMRVIWFRSTALIMNKKYYLTCQIATRIVHV
jgi:multimeric flavodoxin WrbA